MCMSDYMEWLVRLMSEGCLECSYILQFIGLLLSVLSIDRDEVALLHTSQSTM